MQLGWIKLAIACFALIVGGVTAVAQLTKHSRARKRMRAAPSELADNAVVTLTGTVRLLAEPLIAPLSGTPCVLYRATARLPTSAFSQLGTPLVPGVPAEENAGVISKTEMITFVLVTRDGDIVIDGTEAELPIRGAPIIPRKLAREQAFLDAAYVRNRAQNVGFDEVVIEPGMKISVHGIARVEISPTAAGEAGYREAPTVVRLVGDERHPLTIDHA